MSKSDTPIDLIRVFSVGILDNQRVDIVLPCYNPPESWQVNVLTNIEALQTAFADVVFHCIVVIDGKSSAGGQLPETEQLSLRSDVEIIKYDKNRGKGYALRKGVRKSDAKIVLYTDIDFPYTLASMQDCLNAVIQQQCDVAVAVRNRSYYEALPAGRRFISRALKSANRRLLSLKTSDTQGGLKVFNQAGRTHFLSTSIDRYLFDLEFVYKCSKDKKIGLCQVESDLKSGLEFSDVPIGILCREASNFLLIMLRG